MPKSKILLFSAQCPYCRSIDFRRVGIRNTMEKMLFWLLQPYRCGLCGRHFFLFRWQAADPATLGA